MSGPPSPRLPSRIQAPGTQGLWSGLCPAYLEGLGSSTSTDGRHAIPAEDSKPHDAHGPTFLPETAGPRMAWRLKHGPQVQPRAPEPQARGCFPDSPQVRPTPLSRGQGEHHSSSWAHPRGAGSTRCTDPQGSLLTSRSPGPVLTKPDRQPGAGPAGNSVWRGCSEMRVTHPAWLVLEAERVDVTWGKRSSTEELSWGSAERNFPIQFRGSVGSERGGLGKL